MATFVLGKTAHRRPLLGCRCAFVPVADGPEGELAVDLACRFADDRHAVVVALAAIEIPLEQPLEAPAGAAEERAHTLLQRAIAIGESYGVRVVPRIVRTRSATDALVHEAACGGADLIVLALPRLGRRSRSLARTVDAVLKHAPCRVVLASAPPPGS